jgi:hypothetical protein
MDSTRFELPPAVRGLLAACSVATVLLLLAYVAYFGKPDFSSDDAVLSMQAESMWEQGALFPKGWIYNNGDLLTPSGTMLLAPLLAWFPNSYELHAVAGFFAVLLLLGSAIRLLVLMKVPMPVVCVAVAVVASGLSRMSAIMLYLQTTYVWWPAGFLLGAAILFQQRDMDDSARLKSRSGLIGLALIVFLLGFTNPGRALLMLVFPLYVFDRALVGQGSTGKSGLMVRFQQISGVRDPLVVFGIAIPFLVASLVYLALLRAGVVRSLDGAAALRWDGLDGLVSHARIFASGWFDYLGGGREANAAWGKLETILRPARMAFAVWLTWVGMAEILRIRRSEEPARAALAFAFIAAFAPILVLYLLFSPLAQNYSTTRYFTVAIFVLIVLAAIRVARSTGWRRQILKWMCLPLSALFLTICVNRFVPAFPGNTGPDFPIGSSAQMRLAKVLMDQGLKWGYATWWNAGATTVLSDGRSRVSPVGLNNGWLTPYPVMRQNNWYSPEAWRGETFLALSHGEASAGNLKVMDVLLGKPVRAIESPEYEIRVYADNIASRFACIDDLPTDARLDSGPAPAHVTSADLISLDGGRRRPGLAKVMITNDGNARISGHGRFPVAIGIRLIDLGEIGQTREWVHWPLPCGVDPGQEKLIVVALPELPVGRWEAEVNLLQEGVIWFDQLGAKSIFMKLDEMSGDSISSRSFDIPIAR